MFDIIPYLEQHLRSVKSQRKKKFTIGLALKNPSYFMRHVMDNRKVPSEILEEINKDRSVKNHQRFWGNLEEIENRYNQLKANYGI